VSKIAGRSIPFTRALGGIVLVAAMSNVSRPWNELWIIVSWLAVGIIEFVVRGTHPVVVRHGLRRLRAQRQPAAPVRQSARFDWRRAMAATVAFAAFGAFAGFQMAH
jgi:hypothetical protein